MKTCRPQLAHRDNDRFKSEKSYLNRQKIELN